MKLLMLSTDRAAFSQGTYTRDRFVEYGRICDELHIIVFTKRGYNKETIGDNVYLYPTNSISRLFYVFDAIRIGRKIKDIDLVSTQDPFEVGLAGFFISKKNKSKFHVQIHTDLFSPYFEETSFLNKIRVRISKFIIKKAGAIRVVSDRIKDSLIKYGFSNGENISVLPIFLDVERIMSDIPKFSLKDKYPQFDFFIITVARLEVEKNIEMAIKALIKIIKQYPRVCFLVVGDGSHRNRLEKQVNKLGLNNNIIFVGTQKDPISYYKGANLYLSSSNYEGYGLSLMEAALSGCPIVTTNVGIAGYILKNEEGALISEPKDYLGLRKNINRMILDGEFRKEMKRVAMAEALKNSYKNKKEYLDLYLKGLQF